VGRGGKPGRKTKIVGGVPRRRDRDVHASGKGEKAVLLGKRGSHNSEPVSKRGRKNNGGRVMALAGAGDRGGWKLWVLRGTTRWLN